MAVERCSDRDQPVLIEFAQVVFHNGSREAFGGIRLKSVSYRASATPTWRMLLMHWICFAFPFARADARIGLPLHDAGIQLGAHVVIPLAGEVGDASSHGDVVFVADIVRLTGVPIGIGKGLAVGPGESALDRRVGASYPNLINVGQ